MSSPPHYNAAWLDSFRLRARRALYRPSPVSAPHVRASAFPLSPPPLPISPCLRILYPVFSALSSDKEVTDLPSRFQRPFPAAFFSDLGSF